MDRIKHSPFVQFFYNLPGVRGTYHFLWAWAGAKLHQHPSKKIFVIGVTGTKGKTTTLELLNAILEAAGKRTALLSSLRIKIGEDSQKNNSGNSMPGRANIQKFLHDAVRAQCNYALIEVTSQGVEAHRHKYIEWNMGILTNIAPEHIEAHGSFEKYRAAKLAFLKYVLEGGGKVFLNRDDRNFPFFSEALFDHEVMNYSKDEASLKDYLPLRPKFLLSDFNLSNIAAAVAIGKDMGIGHSTIEEALAAFEGVEGRMEFVKKGEYTAVVDYAHTPDSLEAAYGAVRPRSTAQYPDPKLICVLGAAGGGRDRWKRPAMGTIAAEYCDRVILTDEDPYDEDPEQILSEIEEGIVNSERKPTGIYKIPNRSEAINEAVSHLQPGDVVIGTGKGSEEWIHIAHGQKVPWNERAAFETALRDKALGQQ